jgi:hypothetical protein
MTTSANHAGTVKRFSEVVWTSIQGLDIIGRETSFWENDTVLSHERPFFSSSTSNFLLVSSLRVPWALVVFESVTPRRPTRQLPRKPGLTSFSLSSPQFHYKRCMIKTFYLLTNTKQLCYNVIEEKSNPISLSSNRNSFGISLLLRYPSNTTERPLCQLD